MVRTKCRKNIQQKKTRVEVKISSSYKQYFIHIFMYIHVWPLHPFLYVCITCHLTVFYTNTSYTDLVWAMKTVEFVHMYQSNKIQHNELYFFFLYMQCCLCKTARISQFMTYTIVAESINALCTVRKQFALR